MSIYLTGEYSDGATNYGVCYAKVTNTGALTNDRYLITITLYSDSAMTKSVYSRSDISLDSGPSGESTDDIAKRALNQFRQSLATSMALIEPEQPVPLLEPRR